MFPKKKVKTEDGFKMVNVDVAVAQEQYAEIVADVKRDYAEIGRAHAGDEVSHEIAQRWHKKCGVPFKAPAPTPLSGPPPKPEALPEDLDGTKVIEKESRPPREDGEDEPEVAGSSRHKRRL